MKHVLGIITEPEQSANVSSLKAPIRLMLLGVVKMLEQGEAAAAPLRAGMVYERVRGIRLQRALERMRLYAWLRPSRPWLRRAGPSTSTEGHTWIRPVSGEELRRVDRLNVQAGCSWAQRGEHLIAHVRRAVRVQQGVAALAMAEDFGHRVDEEALPRQQSDLMVTAILARESRDASHEAGDVEQALASVQRLREATTAAMGVRSAMRRCRDGLTAALPRRQRGCAASRHAPRPRRALDSSW